MTVETVVIDFSHPPTSNEPDVIYSILDLQVASYTSSTTERDLLLRAYQRASDFHCGIKRDSGEPYITHPLHVALILSHLQLDIETLAAALLHDVLEDTKATHQQLVDEFGVEIADLVEGVTKLSKVSETSRADQSAANIQKVFLAMSGDLRVIFIKLADRLHNLRTLGTRQNAESRNRSAEEALGVYARIADRLGIAIVRKEIEDIAFSYLNPSLSQRIELSIKQRYAENADTIRMIQAEVLSLTEQKAIRIIENGIRTNPRCVYDMFRRLQGVSDPHPGKPNRVPPLLRFHLIVEDDSSCYLAMAEIHARWPAIASETRDYISAPLTNGYRSLHTTVNIDEQPVKFQIGTRAMHTS